MKIAIAALLALSFCSSAVEIIPASNLVKKVSNGKLSQVIEYQVFNPSELKTISSTLKSECDTAVMTVETVPIFNEEGGFRLYNIELEVEFPNTKAFSHSVMLDGVDHGDWGKLYSRNGNSDIHFFGMGDGDTIVRAKTMKIALKTNEEYRIYTFNTSLFGKGQ